MTELLSSGTLSPAYGRDYRSKQAIQEAFLSGADFIYHSPSGGFTYCSVRDFAPGAMVTLRYAKLTKATCFRGHNGPNQGSSPK